MAIDRFSFGVQRVPIGTKESVNARVRAAREERRSGREGEIGARDGTGKGERAGKERETEEKKRGE